MAVDNLSLWMSFVCNVLRITLCLIMIWPWWYILWLINTHKEQKTTQSHKWVFKFQDCEKCASKGGLQQAPIQVQWKWWPHLTQKNECKVGVLFGYVRHWLPACRYFEFSNLLNEQKILAKNFSSTSKWISSFQI